MLDRYGHDGGLLLVLPHIWIETCYFTYINCLVCLGYYELSQLAIRVSDVKEPWHAGNNYVQCGFRDVNGPGNGGSFTIECDGKPHGRYVTLLRTGGDESGSLLFCEVVVMGYKVTGKSLTGGVGGRE